jgi:hypothetical protein
MRITRHARAWLLDNAERRSHQTALHRDGRTAIHDPSSCCSKTMPRRGCCRRSEDSSSAAAVWCGRGPRLESIWAGGDVLARCRGSSAIRTRLVLARKACGARVRSIAFEGRLGSVPPQDHPDPFPRRSGLSDRAGHDQCGRCAMRRRTRSASARREAATASVTYLVFVPPRRSGASLGYETRPGSRRSGLGAYPPSRAICPQ